MKLNYITTEVIKSEDGSYGILARGPEGISEYRSISRSEEKVKLMSDIINRNRVSPVHLRDVIEDLMD